MKKIGVRLAVLYCCMSFTGCAVAQWQREHLADPVMQFNNDPLGDKLEKHFLPTREGSTGSSGGSGGGCGC